MSSNGASSNKIEILGYQLYHLISIGKKESVELMIKKLQQGNIVHYLIEKYKEHLAHDFESVNCPYDISVWEEMLQPYTYITSGHEVNRKMGIMQKDDGILMLSFLITEILADITYKK